MRKHTLDNRKVLCRSAPYVSYYKACTLKRGDMFLYEQDNHRFLARSLGRIASCDNDGLDCTGWIVCLVTSEDHRSVYMRWVDPNSVRAIFDAPTKMMTLFFAPELPPLSDIMEQYERGSLCETFLP